MPNAAAAPVVRLSKIGYVILWVRDTRPALAFYRDTLGMAVRVDSPDWVELEGGGPVLALHQRDGLPKHPPAGTPEVVFSVGDVRSAFAALQRQGVRFEHELRVVHEDAHGSVLAAEFRDPDGNRLSICGRVSKA